MENSVHQTGAAGGALVPGGEHGYRASQIWPGLHLFQGNTFDYNVGLRKILI
jgi:hypothetical protein